MDNAIKQLKAAAHHLKPVVLMGNKGLTDGLLKACDQALSDHELIKIKLVSSDKQERDEILANLCQNLNALLVQTLGHIAILYRKNLHKN